MDDTGIYINNTCHYYQVLRRICLKINLYTQESDNSKINNLDANDFRKQQDKKTYNYETSSAKDNEKEKYKNKL